MSEIQIHLKNLTSAGRSEFDQTNQRPSKVSGFVNDERKESAELVLTGSDGSEET